jgi:hypothetical protein
MNTSELKTMRELSVRELDQVSGGGCTCPGCCSEFSVSGSTQISVNCEGTLGIVVGAYFAPLRD